LTLQKVHKIDHIKEIHMKSSRLINFLKRHYHLMITKRAWLNLQNVWIRFIWNYSGFGCMGFPMEGPKSLRFH